MTRLDTRELQAELDELEARDDDPGEGEGLDADEIERRDAIRELAESGIEDWNGGATLIPEDEFGDYARELAEETGAVPDDAAWPLTCIDWSQAADDLRTDYTSVTFDGSDYLVG